MCIYIYIYMYTYTYPMKSYSPLGTCRESGFQPDINCPSGEAPKGAPRTDGFGETAGRCSETLEVDIAAEHCWLVWNIWIIFVNVYR